MKHAAGAEGGLERVVLEPVIQQLGDRHRQHAQQVDDRLFAHPPRLEAETGEAHQLAQVPRLHVGRRHGVQRLQETREAVHAAAERRPLGRVGRAHAPDRFRRLLGVLPQLQPATAGQRHGDPRVRPHHPQAVTVQVQVVDHFGRHPPRVERAVDHGALLEHQHLAPRARQRVCRDEAVAPRADDDRVGRHAPSPSIASAARRPDAPMMPPPGCVPAPHWYKPRTGVR